MIIYHKFIQRYNNILCSIALDIHLGKFTSSQNFLRKQTNAPEHSFKPLCRTTHFLRTVLSHSLSYSTFCNRYSKQVYAVNKIRSSWENRAERKRNMMWDYAIYILKDTKNPNVFHELMEETKQCNTYLFHIPSHKGNWENSQ